MKKQLGENQKIVESLKRQINFFGRIPQDQVAEAVRQADFSLVIRPNRESSNAGFPTKLAESMAVATPIFANLTGDIGLYVKNGINGLVSASDSQQDVVKTLRRALKMQADELEAMRISARKTALQAFDYRAYKQNLNEFISNVMHGGKQ